MRGSTKGPLQAMCQNGTKPIQSSPSQISKLDYFRETYHSPQYAERKCGMTTTSKIPTDHLCQENLGPVKHAQDNSKCCVVVNKNKLTGDQRWASDGS